MTTWTTLSRRSGTSVLKLPDVTLLLLTSKDWYGATVAMGACQQKVEFGGAKIVWDCNIRSVDDWNRAVIRDLYKYCDTSHMLLIHQDGYVKNPDAWDPEWLKLDYIGSPWPLPQDDFSYRTPKGELVRVGNSVSLRSRALMELVSHRPHLRHYGNRNEDGQVCVWERDWLVKMGCKFGTFEQALRFGKEWELPEHEGLPEPFIFHSTT